MRLTRPTKLSALPMTSKFGFRSAGLPGKLWDRRSAPMLPLLSPAQETDERGQSVKELSSPRYALPTALRYLDSGLWRMCMHLERLESVISCVVKRLLHRKQVYTVRTKEKKREETIWQNACFEHTENFLATFMSCIWTHTQTHTHTHTHTAIPREQILVSLCVAGASLVVCHFVCLLVRIRVVGAPCRMTWDKTGNKMQISNVCARFSPRLSLSFHYYIIIVSCLTSCAGIMCHTRREFVVPKLQYFLSFKYI